MLVKWVEGEKRRKKRSRWGCGEAGSLGVRERREGAPLGSVYSGSHQVIFDRIKMSFGPLYLAQLLLLGKEHLTFRLWRRGGNTNRRGACNSAQAARD